MASEVDICNLGLAHLGNRANLVSLNAGSAEADHCRRFYPIARDKMLSAHAWHFATRTVQLSLLADTAPPGWGYVFTAPSDMLRPFRLIREGTTDDTKTERFTTQLRATTDEQVILADINEEVWLVHAIFVTNTARFSPLFVSATALLLASYLAGPLTKDAKLKESMFKLAMAELDMAKANDANTARTAQSYATFEPDWIANR